jgi:hypothetical protein
MGDRSQKKFWAHETGVELGGLHAGGSAHFSTPWSGRPFERAIPSLVVDDRDCQVLVPFCAELHLSVVGSACHWVRA